MTSLAPPSWLRATSALFVTTAFATAQTVPAGFTIDTLVSTGLSTPYDFCFLPDGRCLIANAGGSVSVYAGNLPVTIGIVPNVELSGERGLLSIAADPAFSLNGYFYTYYCSSTDAFIHVDRFTCTGALANPTSTNLQFAASSQRAILGALPDTAPYHNGGSLRFGPDGMLYISIGDDGDKCSAQIPGSGVGCMLRLDVSGVPSGPSSTPPSFYSLDPGNNPLSSSTGLSRLVIAHGLRNPFRISIDAVTGSVFLADVGQAAVEEVSEYVFGPTLPLVNFGWPWREGDIAGPDCGGTAPTGMVEPIVALPHSANWTCITGVERYRNLGTMPGFGNGYEGDVFCIDYTSGQMLRLKAGPNGWSPATPVAGQQNASDWGLGFSQTFCLRLGPDNCLWYSQDHFAGGLICRIRKLGLPNSVEIVSGDRQCVASGDAFPQPLVARAYDAQGNALVGGPVQFTAVGPATLSTSTAVLTDASGIAQVQLTANPDSGPVRVTATTPGATSAATFDLFTRGLLASSSGQSLSLKVTNRTAAAPAQVPYVLMMAFPGSPTVSTPIGSLCIDPTYALAIIIEDGVGVFGGISFSGTGSIGDPDLLKTYPLPPGLFNGMLMSFQAVGVDPITGWFRTNCQQLQF